jgi:hypothetical protein
LASEFGDPYSVILHVCKVIHFARLRQLSALCGFSEVADFQRAHRDWVDEAIKREMVARESRWSEAVAVGCLSFVNTVKRELGFKAAHPYSLDGSSRSNRSIANAPFKP